MKSHCWLPLAAVVLTGAAPAVLAAGILAAGIEAAGAQSGDLDEVISPAGVAPTLALTPAQRSAIYRAVSKDKSKAAPTHVPTRVGAEVPPMIALYPLPDDILAENPVARLYKYTVTQDQVVLVDPTNMRIVTVIGRQQRE